jgi:hypothetical protein
MEHFVSAFNGAQIRLEQDRDQLAALLDDLDHLMQRMRASRASWADHLAALVAKYRAQP